MTDVLRLDVGCSSSRDDAVIRGIVAARFIQPAIDRLVPREVPDIDLLQFPSEDAKQVTIRSQ